MSKASDRTPDLDDRGSALSELSLMSVPDLRRLNCRSFGQHAGGQFRQMPEEPVEVRENGLTVTAEFVSDEGLALTWSQSGREQEPIAIPLADGKQKLRRSHVEHQLMMQIPASVVARLVTLLAEEYPDAFDPETPDWASSP